MADQNPDDDVRAGLSKLPHWYGIKDKDTFTPLQWVERIDRAREANNWNDNQTMAFVYNAIRGRCLLWWDSLTRMNINKNVWADFRVAFLEAYSATRTARTATINIVDLRQGATESVLDFHSRVVKAVDDMEALLPAAQRLPGPNRFTAPVVALAGWAALAQGAKDDSASAYMVEATTRAFNHMGLQIFISNLRPALRDELMKSIPQDFYTAYQAAIALEKILTEPKRSNFASVQAVGTDYATEEDLEIELAAVQQRLDFKKFGKSRGQSRGRSQQRGGRGQQRGGRGGGGTPQQSGQNPDYNKCRHCGITGHIQKVCFKRIAANAPMVDKNGKPYPTNANGVQMEGDEGEAQQQGGTPKQNQGGAQAAGGYFLPPADNGYSRQDF